MFLPLCHLRRKWRGNKSSKKLLFLLFNRNYSQRISLNMNTQQFDFYVCDPIVLTTERKKNDVYETQRGFFLKGADVIAFLFLFLCLARVIGSSKK
jgi:hypothetical protein